MGVGDMGKTSFIRYACLRGTVDFEIAEEGKSTQPKQPIATMSATKCPGSLSSPEVLFGNELIVDQVKP
jgi:hypothetical protein